MSDVSGTDEDVLAEHEPQDEPAAPVVSTGADDEAAMVTEAEPASEHSDATPEATFAEADPFSPGEVANREASLAAAEEAAGQGPAAEDHAERDEAEQADPPAAYIADGPLFTGDPGESGSVPVRAFNPGDLVLPADVWRNGWREQVHAPEGYEPTEPSPEGEQK
jgi:hypothetical protein